MLRLAGSATLSSPANGRQWSNGATVRHEEFVSRCQAMCSSNALDTNGLKLDYNDIVNISMLNILITFLALFIRTSKGFLPALDMLRLRKYAAGSPVLMQPANSSSLGPLYSVCARRSKVPLLAQRRCPVTRLCLAGLKTD